MKKRGGRFLLILGAGLALLAFAVVYILTSKNAGNASANPDPATLEPQMATVAVVNADVPAYTVLDASNVATVDVEASTVISGTSSNPNMLYGKMTLMPLSKGQPVMVNQLTTSGFSNVIEKGKRAYTLPIPERGTFGGALSENDYVDLLWTASFEVTQPTAGGDGKTETTKKDLHTTKTILQNVQVLRMISLRPNPPPPSAQGTANGQAEPTSAGASTSGRSAPATTAAYAVDAPPQAVIIVAVTDQQAEVIKYAQENGTVDLALRSSAAQKGPDGQTLKGPDGKDIVGDHDPEKTTGITGKVLVEQYGLLVPEIIEK